MSTLNKNIGLIGFGVVGQGFYSYLEENKEDKLLPNIVIKNTDKERDAVRAKFITESDKVINDASVETVVELITDDKEALDIVTKALKAGKNVVSANKKMIANNLEQLVDLENKSKGRFLYEGAVCGSIPIIKTLNEYYSLDTVTQIQGIFNGSTNYILTQIFKDNASYEESLAKAQKLGFAEADPTSDVSGSDALYKLLILTTHAFGKFISPNKALKIGIQNITENDIAFALENNLKIKLIASVKTNNNKLWLSVLPTFVTTDSVFYNVDNEFNAVEVVSEGIGKQTLIGKGAGSLPTGQVIYSDYKSPENYKYKYDKILSGKRIKYETQELIWIYSDKITQFEKYIEQVVIINKSQGYAKISIADLIKVQEELLDEKLSIIALTDETLKQLNKKYEFAYALQYA
ncbi:MAG: homoserine dehydrogenase [Flavobacteriales bacterium]|nr:homoserine dehydrogenase [Flavobacteriales bacterium]MCB9364298.1 homoserine dehydrogenase [Flavobacteriales bacterium]